MECKDSIRTTHGIFCSKCGEGVHKREPCSGMKRKQRDDISSGKLPWICDGCKGKIANPYPKEENKEVEYVTGKTSDKIKELKIIQWNAEAYLSKKEEFTSLIYEKDIDIFVIQETKMITKDKTPNLPGYEIKRREREQRKGKEDNRGGGLLIGIKDTIPVRELQNNLRGDNDEITEWMTIEIPTGGKHNIRITNMYIPPTRETESEKKRQRKKTLDLEKWPCSRADIILGDVKAQSPIGIMLAWNDQGCKMKEANR